MTPAACSWCWRMFYQTGEWQQKRAEMLNLMLLQGQKSDWQWMAPKISLVCIFFLYFESSSDAQIELISKPQQVQLHTEIWPWILMTWMDEYLQNSVFFPNTDNREKADMPSSWLSLLSSFLPRFLWQLRLDEAIDIFILQASAQ